MAHTQVCLILVLWQITGMLLVAAESNQYWSNKYNGSSTARNIKTTISHTSAITCVSLCLQTENCSSIHTVKETTPLTVTCYLLSDSDNGIDEILPEGKTYNSLRCPFWRNPCDSNPCLNGGNCSASPDFDCNNHYFDCTCSEFSEGRYCETCIANHTGPNCVVDTTDSVELDGTYFYMVNGIRNGSEIADMQPNCTESRKLCAKRGMKLLTIRSEEKNATVANLLQETVTCKRCFYQLGMKRETVDAPYVWDDGSTLDSFTGWYKGYPLFENDSIYAVLSPGLANSWTDANCSFLAYYVCEYEPQ